MKKAVAFAIGLVAMAASGSHALAQTQTGRLTISPTVGWYLPRQDLRQVPEGETTVGVRGESSPVIGLALEARVAGTPISARAQVAYAPGDLVAVRFAGEESCGTNCIRNVYTHDRLASTSALLLVGDAVLRSRRGRLRPYVAAGGGVRRYGFNQDDLEGEFATAFAEDVTRFVAHFGAGLDVSVGKSAVTAEFGDYFGQYPRSGPASAPVNGLQHDFAGSLGIRLALPW